MWFFTFTCRFLIFWNLMIFNAIFSDFLIFLTFALIFCHLWKLSDLEFAVTFEFSFKLLDLYKHFSIVQILLFNRCLLWFILALFFILLLEIYQKIWNLWILTFVIFNAISTSYSWLAGMFCHSIFGSKKILLSFQ